MKKTILTVLLLVIAIGTIPLISVMIGLGEYDIQVSATEKPTEKVLSTSIKATESSETKKNKKSATENLQFKIYDKSVKKIITVSDFDFCCGALATETESDIPFEALKSLAVTIHSYYSYLRAESRAENKEYDFECNSKIWNVYASKEDLKEKLRDTFEESYGNIEKAVSEVSDVFVVYDNKPCMTKFFEISSGNTYSYNEIYGYDIPYLQSVPSPFDCTANNYTTRVALKTDEFDKIIKEKYSDYTPNKDLKNNIGEIILSENGALLNIEVGNKSIDGKDFVNIMGLRSNKIDISYKNDTYFFTVYGYGENIGLSKYGAYKLAEQGQDFCEILKYYFPNADILKGYSPF